MQGESCVGGCPVGSGAGLIGFVIAWELCGDCVFGMFDCVGGLVVAGYFGGYIIEGSR